jgi:hypothetical protein
MQVSIRSLVIGSIALLTAGFAGGAALGRQVVHAQPGPRVFELRTYTTPAGKLEDLHARFRNHTLGFFEKYGMTSIGYWRPLDEPLKSNTLIYLLGYPDRASAEASWKAFRSDPAWQKVVADSQMNGSILDGVVSVFLEPTDYSPMK